jgi:hypothetical protein
MPFRSDSLLGLVRPAPAPVMQAELAELGIHPRHPLTALEPSHRGRT